MIDLISTPLREDDYSKFASLCDRIYEQVEINEGINLFMLSLEFDDVDEEIFNLAVSVLLQNGYLKKGSLGLIAGDRPEYSGISHQLESDKSKLVGGQGHLDKIVNIESKLSSIIELTNSYKPAPVIENYIKTLKRSPYKTTLYAYFIELDEYSSLYKENKKAGSFLNRFCDDFEADETDRELYATFEISKKSFMYLFNRTEGYYRFLELSIDPGEEDLLKRIFNPTLGNLYANLNPRSEEKIDLGSRLVELVEVYLHKYGVSTENLLDVLLAITEDTSHSIRDLFFVCESIENMVGLGGLVLEKDRMDPDNLFQHCIVSEEGRVKMLSSRNIQALLEIIWNEDKVKYGISVNKMFLIHQGEMLEHSIFSYVELNDFILKFTDYTVENGRIIRNKTIKECITDFIIDTQTYNKESAKRKYGRVCGGPRSYTGPIIDSIDIDELSNDKVLKPEEMDRVASELKDYEWITRTNAESIFSDKLGLENKFTDQNMHSLGFARRDDAYYRDKYASFIDCIRHTEFVGDDVYVDGRDFQIKMECKAFSTALTNLQRQMYWFPVSEHRYINLRSERFSDFARVVKQYSRFVVELCKKEFVTPLLLKNRICGIEEIDEEDYDLNFYEAVLLSASASKVKCGTIASQRFFYLPSEVSEFQCNGPEFIRFIVHEAGGIMSMDELRSTMDEMYGIRCELPILRNVAKQSSCRYSNETDTLYYDDFSFLEAMRYE